MRLHILVVLLFVTEAVPYQLGTGLPFRFLTLALGSSSFLPKHFYLYELSPLPLLGFLVWSRE